MKQTIEERATMYGLSATKHLSDSLRPQAVQRMHDIYKAIATEQKRIDIEELKGDLEKEYIGAIDWEEGCFVFSSNGEYNDCFLSVLFGNMKNSDPIFDFEAIGNIHDNPELLKK